MKNDPLNLNIVANNVDDLVKKGICNVMKSGERVVARAGKALQCYGINYVLTKPTNRVHTRKNALQYFTRELLAYFDGSLDVNNGLSFASKRWNELANDVGKINSNYGYYIFHDDIKNEQYNSQYEWVVKRLLENMNSRRAIININQSYHKSETKDFPCTVALS